MKALAQSGHGDRAQQCPLSGVKRTSTDSCFLKLLRQPKSEFLGGGKGDVRLDFHSPWSRRLGVRALKAISS